MPQPHLPAPLASRPDPGAMLLEAVRQRQRESSLKLTQQWVHRRGVLDLERFCSTQLTSALGSEALVWLQELLDLGTAIPIRDTAPSSSFPGAPSASDDSLSAASLSAANQSRSADIWGVEAESAAAGQAATADPAVSPDVPPTPLHPPLAPAAPSPMDEAPAPDPELQARAVTAVDEAFAALAQSFQEETEAAASAPLPSFPEPSPAAKTPPQPMPVPGSLWPSLQASATGLSSAIAPGSGGQSSLAAVSQCDSAAPLRPVQVQPDGGISLDASASPAPHPQHNPTAAEAQPSLAASEPAHGPAMLADGHSAESAEQGGLFRRLRGRLQTGGLQPLSRLRTVMRDCVEETMALLSPPESERQDEDGGSDTYPLSAPSLAADEQPSASWDIDPFLPPSTAPVSGAEAQAEAEASPATVADSQVPEANSHMPEANSQVPEADSRVPEANSHVPEANSHVPEADSHAPAPSLPSRAPRLRFRLPVSQRTVGGDRPAPAPPALSDLRAWLPDPGDLPRAS